MPRLASLTTKLTSVGSKKTPVFIKTFTGTDFSSFHSTWTFSTGTISLVSSSLPYHSYGNSSQVTTATNQGCSRTWSLRAGTNTGTDVIVQINSINSGNFLLNQSVSSTTNVSVNMPIVFDTSISEVVAGQQYFVKAVSTNSFTVSETYEGRALTLTSAVPLNGTISFETSATGNIGYWVNGVNMFNPSAASEAPNGYLTFPNLNYNAAYEAGIEFSISFDQDRAGGHVVDNGNYHYHNFSFSSAWTTGTAHVGTGTKVVSTGSAELSIIPYFNGTLRHSDGHSKILGWSLDGFPVYGPYGYNQAIDCNSGVRPLKSSYAVYDSPLKVNERVTSGVFDIVSYPMGIFIQDHYFAGNGDLDVFNGRYCVTPEYPQGTYAYFSTIDAVTGKPAYPYVIGNFHKSVPLQGTQTTSTSTNGGGFAPKQTG
jgi:hypothetical protein